MATNYVKASYTEVIDLQTTNGKTSIIGIHTPVGPRPYHRLKGFFNQFQKYRYKGISNMIMVPAANLPVDPLGLTGVPGTTDLMDPRDALNPILFHGAHGENLNSILNTIYSGDERATANSVNYSDGGRNVSDSMSESESTNLINTDAYYRCLTDVTWRKFGIQSGVKLKGLHPLVHKLATNMPIVPSYATNQIDPNTGQYVEYNADTTTGAVVTGAPPQGEVYKSDLTSPMNITPDVDTYFGAASQVDAAYMQQMTNGCARLGWLPTTKTNATTDNHIVTRTIATLPRLYMGVLVLPPSYNVEQFFRCVIRHEFEFSQFTTSLGAMAGDVTVPTGNNESRMVPYFNWIDYGDSKIAMGETIDMIDGNSEVVSDGVA